jgi:phage terminase large subunit
MELSIKQTQAIDVLENSNYNTLLYGGAAGGGKSILGCYWIAKNCLKYPGTRWVIGRSRLKTLKETTLLSLFEVLKIQGLTAQVDYTYNEPKSLITFHKTKSTILLKDLFAMPSDPQFDALGSLECTGAFIDEASEITPTAYSILQSRIRYKLDENNLIPRMLLTCNPSKAWLYTTFYKPYINGTLDSKKYFIQSLVTDNPHISKHYIAQLEGLDMINKKRLLFGDWTYSDDESNLFSVDKLNDMFTNSYISGGDRYMSIDVARYGRDKSVICIWDGWRCIKILTYDKNSLSELAENVKAYAETYKISRSNIIVDSDGVGGAIPDFIRGIKSFVNNSKALNNENYRNLKSQCYYDFANQVNKGLVYISTDSSEIKQNIISEFELIKQYDIDKDSKLAITPKDKIKSLLGRSPDIADALIMRSYFNFNRSKLLYFA